MKRLAVLLLLVVACGSPSPEFPSQEVSGGGNVMEVTLSDGTRCAVAESGYGISVDCDWSDR